MTSKIDELLEFLTLDGTPHSIEEISEVLKIPHSTCECIAHFLAKYDFIQFSDSKMKINARMRKFVIASSGGESVLRVMSPLASIPSLQKR